MTSTWREVFERTLGQMERNYVSELIDARNRWAHQEPFSSDDAYRAELRERGARTAQRYSWERTARELCALLRDVSLAPAAR